MSRCIVNVATDRYVPLQERLIRSLASVNYRDGLLAWKDGYPPGSPSHMDSPYAFKLYAIGEAARRGHRIVLWLDAPCVAVKPLGQLFDRIEGEGHLLVAGDEKVGNWANDACLAEFSLTRDDAMGLRLMNGTFIGLDLGDARCRMWLDGLFSACEKGLFRGPYLSDNAPEEVKALKPGKPTGFVSRDPRCWGHRHDEAVGSCLAARLGMKFGRLSDISEIEYRKDLEGVASGGTPT